MSELRELDEPWFGKEEPGTWRNLLEHVKLMDELYASGNLRSLRRVGYYNQTRHGMTRRTKLWLYGSLLFTFINIGGAVIAAARGEVAHAVGHTVLVLLGGLYLAWRVSSRARREGTPDAPQFDERLDRLQQSLDAIAVEVERVGEGQRFVTKLGQQARD
ncbi:MAG: hypothetical protein ACSLFE_00170 [Gemmatimonadaceae bacterium]